MKTEGEGEGKHFFFILSAIRTQFDTEPPLLVDFCGCKTKTAHIFTNTEGPNQVNECSACSKCTLYVCN